MKVSVQCLVRILIVLVITLGSQQVFALSTSFISAPNRVDMVYDDARGVLYITSGSSVLRYKVSTSSFLAPYTFNLGNLSGIDLSQDGNSLAIADRNITGIHLVDLQTDTIKPDIMFTPGSGEAGSFTVAYGNDGALLVTTGYNGSGWVPLRRVDPATGAVTTIKSSISRNSMLSASADGKCIGFVESNNSSGPVRIYDVATKQVTTSATTTWYNYEIGTNRDCSQFAVPTYGGTFVYNNSLVKQGALGAYAGAQPIGVAYHPIKDIVYFAWTETKEVRAFDTNTFSQVGSFDVGYTFTSTGNNAFGQGRVRVSRDGSFFFVTVANGIRFGHASSDPVANGQSLFTNGVAAATITLTGNSPNQLPLTYSVVTQPAHGLLQGTAPNLTYTPDQGYNGQDGFTFKVSNGTTLSPAATVLITIDRVAPTITSFKLPSTSTSSTVTITELLAGDYVGVSGYCLSETAISADCTWSATIPASYTFGGTGSQIVYAFARDAAGNISDPAGAAINIPETGPRITAFSIPSTYPYNNLTIPVTLTASDSIGVTGFCLTETANPGACSWSSSAPVSYTFTSTGLHTIYAFARNGAGSVSASAGATTMSAGSAGLISAPNRVDMVYDNVRDVLYITSETSVLRYKISTKSFLTPYQYGLGNLSGIDLSPDGNTLAIADRNITGIHLVDLQTDTKKPDITFTSGYGEAGSFTVAYGNDGALLVTTGYNGSGWVPLRRVDPATGAVTTIKNSISQNAMLSASADGTCIGYVESNNSSGPVSIYDVATKQATKSATTSWYNYEIGTSRDCTQFAVPTYGGTIIYNNSLTKQGGLGVYAGTQPIGVAYHPATDIAYFAWTGTQEVRAYSTASFSQIASYNVGYTFTNPGNNAFNQGRLKISRDGSALFAAVNGGVYYQPITTIAPIANTLSINTEKGSPVSITLSGSSPAQAALSFIVVAQPAHGTLQGSAPNLVYTPDAAYTGSDTFTFTASDGNLKSSTATVSINVTLPPQYLLTTNIVGNGAINNIRPDSPSFSCSASHCTASFDKGTLFTLRGTPSSLSEFVGWSGGGCNGASDCPVTLDANTTLTATFNALPLVKIVGNPTGFSSLFDAYAAASNGSILKTRNVSFTENVILNRPIGIIIMGGFESDFTTVNGYTYIQGNLSVAPGTLSVDHLIIR